MRIQSVCYLSDKHVLGAMQALDYRMYPIYESFMLPKFKRDKLIASAKGHSIGPLQYSKVCPTNWCSILWRT